MKKTLTIIAISALFTVATSTSFADELGTPDLDAGPNFGQYPKGAVRDAVKAQFRLDQAILKAAAKAAEAAEEDELETEDD